MFTSSQRSWDPCQLHQSQSCHHPRQLHAQAHQRQDSSAKRRRLSLITINDLVTAPYQTDLPTSVMRLHPHQHHDKVEPPPQFSTFALSLQKKVRCTRKQHLLHRVYLRCLFSQQLFLFVDLEQTDFHHMHTLMKYIVNITIGGVRSSSLEMPDGCPHIHQHTEITSLCRTRHQQAHLTIVIQGLLLVWSWWTPSYASRMQCGVKNMGEQRVTGKHGRQRRLSWIGANRNGKQVTLKGKKNQRSKV